ncbi:HNH endonuclease signature motif containing protein [Pseudonocardia eucalypti]|uniref:HNH endonuclease signature motif containing protein n=2 Tax=Pseudonocardia eucalypti TaxID=648755 RepID=A0ABP9QM62_9PSEU|nr:hypothetical protein [Pseudonocardia eucalypti]
MSESTVQVPPVVEPWSRHSPDGLLVDRLSFEPGRGAAELLERVGAWENVRAVVDAQQVRELAGLVAAERADDGLRCPVSDVIRSVATQFALTAGLTQGAALARVEDAMTLVHRLPHILDALGEARLSYRSVRVIIEEFVGLGEQQLDAAQQQILERLAGRNPSQIRGCAKRVVARLDAEAVRKRVERAAAERYVRLEPAADGMATLRAHLPAAQAVTLYGLVNDYARRAGGGPGEDRSMDARRADAMYDLIVNPELDTCHPDPDVAAAEQRRARARERVRTEIRVTVPLSVLVGARDLPGELSGYGPVNAEVARALAGDPTSVWRRLVTDPESGALLDYGTTRYRPPPVLVGFVNARAQTCSIPGCCRPAEDCDTDHHEPFDPDTGNGPTSARNNGPLCRYHHRVKQLPGWNIIRNPDGTTTWTLPTGHRITTPPAEIGEILRPAGPEPPPEAIEPEPPPF